MLAVQIVKPGQVQINDLPIPDFGSEDVLIKIAHVGVCGTDIELLHQSDGCFSARSTNYPIVPGHEWSGTVVEVGSWVTRFKQGDKVTGETGIGCMKCRVCLSLHAPNCCPDVKETGILGRDGAMREYHVHPEAFTRALGDLPLDLAALVEPATVGVWICRRTAVTPADRVAVIGGGPIGLLAAQAARCFGARCVTVISRSEPKLALAKELGADFSVNSRDEDLTQRALEITDGEMFDVVIEAAGNAPALNDAHSITGLRGRIAVAGYASDKPYGHALSNVLGFELSLIGVRGSPGVWPETIDMVRQEKIKVAPLISHRYAFEDFQKAFDLHQQGGPHVQKILIDLE